MPKVPQKTIYVREEDVPLWDWAMAHAKQHRMPISGLLMTALEHYRQAVEAPRDDGE
ncbi:hypothetical protein CLV30_11343 [Haloactinopolyspora alba]|uniref:Uncharacterized protein n=1 Tax=Haloactinopolyspora alba TaxID=648780 RepID=A0A2P8DWF5_9ACTN|nr:hypothetical protein [Haloactinopolyspora alba]PSL01555.1 hypothetical protein CLV30_11343 [Haloactinopolyspora alba]